MTDEQHDKGTTLRAKIKGAEAELEEARRHLRIYADSHGRARLRLSVVRSAGEPAETAEIEPDREVLLQVLKDRIDVLFRALECHKAEYAAL